MGVLHQAAVAVRYPTFTFTTSLLLLLLSSSTGARAQGNTLQTITTTDPDTAVASSFLATPTPSNSPTAPQENAPSTTTNVSPTSATSNPNNGPSQGFNYYFIVIAFAVVLFVLFIIFLSRRRKTRALIRIHTQRTLSQDTAGYHSPHYGRGWGPHPSHSPSSYTPNNQNTITSRVGMRMMGRRREEVPEGLNERGEAPPPYMPGSKPPSLRSDDDGWDREGGVGGRERDVEMGDMRRPVPKEGEQPPGYGYAHGHGHAYGSSSSSASDLRGQGVGGEVTRPEPAVTRPEPAITRPESPVTRS